MGATEVLRAERAALCDTLERVGPDAPTLCEGWTAADLAAHLVVRERDVTAGPGIVLPGPFARYTRERMERVKRRGFAAEVARLRDGPPPWFRGPMAAPNLAENFIHHEDLRRPQGDDPRELDDEVTNLLWSMLRRTARLQFRRARGIGLELVLPDERSKVVRAREPLVKIEGPVGELYLFATGRKDAARVSIEGATEAVEILRSSRLGI